MRPSFRLPLVVALLAIAVPALATNYRGPSFYTDQARDELADLERVASHVRDPGDRAELLARIDRVDALIARAEDELDNRPQAQALSYQDARVLVSGETFDDDKLRVITTLARTSRFSSEEARGLVAEMTFDSGRVDALIVLYPAVRDPERFVTILDVLTFASSRREVEDALGL
jgi:hypothetical protein